LVVSDTLLILVAVLLAFGLQGELSTLLTPSFAIMFLPAMTLLGVALVMSLRLHRIKLVMFNSKDVSKIALAAFCLSLLFVVSLVWLGVPEVLAKSLIFGGAFFCGSVCVRAGAIAALSYLRDRASVRQPVAIFGAGGSGIQLASALRQSQVMRPVFFFDDNLHLQGMAVGGIPVFDTKRMKANLAYHKVETVLIALPESARERRTAIIEQLERICHHSWICWWGVGMKPCFEPLALMKS